MKQNLVLLIVLLISNVSGAHSGDDVPLGSNSSRQVSSGGGDQLQLLLSTNGLSGDGIEIARLTLPGGDGKFCSEKSCRPHQHPVDEIFYVVSGQLEHIVENERLVVGPGMLAVAPKDRNVFHNVVSTEPLVVLVIWLATGEFDRLIEHYGLQQLSDSNTPNEQS